MSLAAVDVSGQDIGYYELDTKLKLKWSEDKQLHEYSKSNAAIRQSVLTYDDASIIYTDDESNRWRLPRAEA